MRPPAILTTLLVVVCTALVSTEAARSPCVIGMLEPVSPSTSESVCMRGQGSTSGTSAKTTFKYVHFDSNLCGSKIPTKEWTTRRVPEKLTASSVPPPALEALNYELRESKVNNDELGSPIINCIADGGHQEAPLTTTEATAMCTGQGRLQSLVCPEDGYNMPLSLLGLPHECTSNGPSLTKQKGFKLTIEPRSTSNGGLTRTKVTREPKEWTRGDAMLPGVSLSKIPSTDWGGASNCPLYSTGENMNTAHARVSFKNVMPNGCDLNAGMTSCSDYGSFTGANNSCDVNLADGPQQMGYVGIIGTNGSSSTHSFVAHSESPGLVQTDNGCSRNIKNLPSFLKRPEGSCSVVPLSNINSGCPKGDPMYSINPRVTCRFESYHGTEAKPVWTKLQRAAVDSIAAMGNDVFPGGINVEEGVTSTDWQGNSDMLSAKCDIKEMVWDESTGEAAGLAYTYNTEVVIAYYESEEPKTKGCEVSVDWDYDSFSSDLLLTNYNRCEFRFYIRCDGRGKPLVGNGRDSSVQYVSLEGYGPFTQNGECTIEIKSLTGRVETSGVFLSNKDCHASGVFFAVSNSGTFWRSLSASWQYFTSSCAGSSSWFKQLASVAIMIIGVLLCIMVAAEMWYVCTGRKGFRTTTIYYVVTGACWYVYAIAAGLSQWVCLNMCWGMVKTASGKQSISTLSADLFIPAKWIGYCCGEMKKGWDGKAREQGGAGQILIAMDNLQNDKAQKEARLSEETMRARPPPEVQAMTQPRKSYYSPFSRGSTNSYVGMIILGLVTGGLATNSGDPRDTRTNAAFDSGTCPSELLRDKELAGGFSIPSFQMSETEMSENTPEGHFLTRSGMICPIVCDDPWDVYTNLPEHGGNPKGWLESSSRVHAHLIDFENVTTTEAIESMTTLVPATQKTFFGKCENRPGVFPSTGHEKLFHPVCRLENTALSRWGCADSSVRNGLPSEEGAFHMSQGTRIVRNSSEASYLTAVLPHLSSLIGKVMTSDFNSITKPFVNEPNKHEKDALTTLSVLSSKDFAILSDKGLMDKMRSETYCAYTGPFNKGCGENEWDCNICSKPEWVFNASADVAPNVSRTDGSFNMTDLGSYDSTEVTNLVSSLPIPTRAVWEVTGSSGSLTDYNVWADPVVVVDPDAWGFGESPIVTPFVQLRCRMKGEAPTRITSITSYHKHDTYMRTQGMGCKLAYKRVGYAVSHDKNVIMCDPSKKASVMDKYYPSSVVSQKMGIGSADPTATASGSQMMMESGVISKIGTSHTDLENKQAQAVGSMTHTEKMSVLLTMPKTVFSMEGLADENLVMLPFQDPNGKDIELETDPFYGFTGLAMTKREAARIVPLINLEQGDEKGVVTIRVGSVTFVGPWHDRPAADGNDKVEGIKLSVFKEVYSNVGLDENSGCTGTHVTEGASCEREGGATKTCEMGDGEIRCRQNGMTPVGVNFMDNGEGEKLAISTLYRATGLPELIEGQEFIPTNKMRRAQYMVGMSAGQAFLDSVSSSYACDQTTTAGSTFVRDPIAETWIEQMTGGVFGFPMPGSGVMFFNVDPGNEKCAWTPAAIMILPATMDMVIQKAECCEDVRWEVDIAVKMEMNQGTSKAARFLMLLNDVDEHQTFHLSEGLSLTVGDYTPAVDLHTKLHMQSLYMYTIPTACASESRGIPNSLWKTVDSMQHGWGRSQSWLEALRSCGGKPECESAVKSSANCWSAQDVLENWPSTTNYFTGSNTDGVRAEFNLPPIDSFHDYDGIGIQPSWCEQTYDPSLVQITEAKNKFDQACIDAGLDDVEEAFNKYFSDSHCSSQEPGGPSLSEVSCGSETVEGKSLCGLPQTSVCEGGSNRVVLSTPPDELNYDEDKAMVFKPRKATTAWGTPKGVLRAWCPLTYSEDKDMPSWFEVNKTYVQHDAMGCDEMLDIAALKMNAYLTGKCLVEVKGKTRPDPNDYHIVPEQLGMHCLLEPERDTIILAELALKEIQWRPGVNRPLLEEVFNVLGVKESSHYSSGPGSNSPVVRSKLGYLPSKAGVSQAEKLAKEEVSFSSGEAEGCNRQTCSKFGGCGYFKKDGQFTGSVFPRQKQAIIMIKRSEKEMDLGWWMDNLMCARPGRIDTIEDWFENGCKGKVPPIETMGQKTQHGATVYYGASELFSRGVLWKYIDIPSVTAKEVFVEGLWKMSDSISKTYVECHTKEGDRTPECKWGLTYGGFELGAKAMAAGDVRLTHGYDASACGMITFASSQGRSGSDLDTLFNGEIGAEYWAEAAGCVTPEVAVENLTPCNGQPAGTSDTGKDATVQENKFEASLGRMVTGGTCDAVAIIEELSMHNLMEEPGTIGKGLSVVPIMTTRSGYEITSMAAEAAASWSDLRLSFVGVSKFNGMQKSETILTYKGRKTSQNTRPAGTVEFDEESVMLIGCEEPTEYGNDERETDRTPVAVSFLIRAVTEGDQGVLSLYVRKNEGEADWSEGAVTAETKMGGAATVFISTQWLHVTIQLTHVSTSMTITAEGRKPVTSESHNFQTEYCPKNIPGTSQWHIRNGGAGTNCDNMKRDNQYRGYEDLTPADYVLNLDQCLKRAGTEVIEITPERDDCSIGSYFAFWGESFGDCWAQSWNSLTNGLLGGGNSCPNVAWYWRPLCYVWAFIKKYFWIALGVLIGGICILSLGSKAAMICLCGAPRQIQQCVFGIFVCCKLRSGGKKDKHSDSEEDRREALSGEHWTRTPWLRNMYNGLGSMTGGEYAATTVNESNTMGRTELIGPGRKAKQPYEMTSREEQVERLSAKTGVDRVARMFLIFMPCLYLVVMISPFSSLDGLNLEFGHYNFYKYGSIIATISLTVGRILAKFPKRIIAYQTTMPIMNMILDSLLGGEPTKASFNPDEDGVVNDKELSNPKSWLVYLILEIVPCSAEGFMLKHIPQGSWFNAEGARKSFPKGKSLGAAMSAYVLCVMEFTRVVVSYTIKRITLTQMWPTSMVLWWIGPWIYYLCAHHLFDGDTAPYRTFKRIREHDYWMDIGAKLLWATSIFTLLFVTINVQGVFEGDKRTAPMSLNYNGVTGKEGIDLSDDYFRRRMMIVAPGAALFADQVLLVIGATFAVIHAVCSMTGEGPPIKKEKGDNSDREAEEAANADNLLVFVVEDISHLKYRGERCYGPSSGYDSELECMNNRMRKKGCNWVVGGWEFASGSNEMNTHSHIVTAPKGLEGGFLLDLTAEDGVDNLLGGWKEHPKNKSLVQRRIAFAEGSMFLMRVRVGPYVNQHSCLASDMSLMHEDRKTRYLLSEEFRVLVPSMMKIEYGVTALAEMGIVPMGGIVVPRRSESFSPVVFQASVIALLAERKKVKEILQSATEMLLTAQLGSRLESKHGLISVIDSTRADTEGTNDVRFTASGPRPLKPWAKGSIALVTAHPETIALPPSTDEWGGRTWSDESGASSHPDGTISWKQYGRWVSGGADGIELLSFGVTSPATRKNAVGNKQPEFSGASVHLICIHAPRSQHAAGCPLPTMVSAYGSIPKWYQANHRMTVFRLRGSEPAESVALPEDGVGVEVSS